MHFVEGKIREKIKHEGHISVRDFMKYAMHNFEESYYRSKLAVGEDFITSPEISQMFGEIISLWIVEKWEKLSRPAKINLIELGPGKGSLISDIARVLSKFDMFKFEIYLYDINSLLINEQKNKLSNYKPKWISEINSFNINEPCIVIANEFFDAFPIEQFIKKNDYWHERVIDISSDNQLQFNINSKMVNLFDDHINALNGAIIEQSLEIIQFFTSIVNLVKKNSGAMLIVDYGYNISPNLRHSNQYQDTLQALLKHNYIDIFCKIGLTDLTAHVDFASLIRILEKNFIDDYNFYTQADFLLKYGIEIRRNLLIKKNPDLKDIIDKQYERLVSSNFMGSLFKVLEFSTDICTN